MKRTLSLLIVMLIVLGICGCQQKPGGSSAPSATCDEAVSVSSPDEAARPATRDEAEPVEPETAPDEYYDRVDEIFAAPLAHTYRLLDAGEWIQYPELPTGCESVALTAALDCLGFDIEKTEIAENYLYYADEDVMYGYVGDPFSDYGAAVYPPGLANTANYYLEVNDSDYRAVTTMGADMQSLFKLIDAGYPVVVWTTLWVNEPMVTDYEYYYNGETYYWYENEHCVLLCGYDLEENTVTISDPNEGIVTHDADWFEAVYDGVGRLSMTIVDLNGNEAWKH